MMSKVKQMIASKFSARGQVVILDSAIRKHHSKAPVKLSHELSSSEENRRG